MHIYVQPHLFISPDVVLIFTLSAICREAEARGLEDASRRGVDVRQSLREARRLGRIGDVESALAAVNSARGEAKGTHYGQLYVLNHCDRAESESRRDARAFTCSKVSEAIAR